MRGKCRILALSFHSIGQSSNQSFKHLRFRDAGAAHKVLFPESWRSFEVHFIVITHRNKHTLLDPSVAPLSGVSPISLHSIRSGGSQTLTELFVEDYLLSTLLRSIHIGVKIQYSEYYLLLHTVGNAR